MKNGPSRNKHLLGVVCTALSASTFNNNNNNNITRKNDIVDNLDYQVPATQLMGPKRNGDMQAAKRE